MKGHPGTQKFGDIPIYTHIYIYSVCLASFWGYSNAECSNYIEPTRKSCMTCCFLHPHFSWPAILSWRFREQALSTAALRQLWWRSWSAKRRSRALNSAISLHRRGVRLFCFTEFEKLCYKKNDPEKIEKQHGKKWTKYVWAWWQRCGGLELEKFGLFASFCSWQLKKNNIWQSWTSRIDTGKKKRFKNKIFYRTNLWKTTKALFVSCFNFWMSEATSPSTKADLPPSNSLAFRRQLPTHHPMDVWWIFLSYLFYWFRSSFFSKRTWQKHQSCVTTKWFYHDLSISNYKALAFVFGSLLWPFNRISFQKRSKKTV